MEKYSVILPTALHAADEMPREHGEGMTRRQMFRIGALSALTLSSLLHAEEKPPADREKSERERALRFARAAEIIEAALIGKVQWHHPMGHKEGSPPVRPVFYLADAHGNQTTVTNENRAKDEWLDFQILNACRRSGLTRLKFEGFPADEAFPPLPIPKDRDGRALFTLEQLRRDMDMEFFMNVHMDTGASAGHIFSAYAGKDAECMGAENPKTFPEFDVKVNRYDQARRVWVNMQKVLETNGGLATIDVRTGYVIAKANGVAIAHIDQYLHAMSAYDNAEKALAKIAYPPCPREEFVDSLDADVVVFGGLHMDRILALTKQQKRSVGIVTNTLAAKSLPAIKKRQERSDAWFFEHRKDMEKMRKEYESRKSPEK